MRHSILSGLLLIALSFSAYASDKTIDCTNLDSGTNSDQLDVCAKQADKQLNDNYQALRDTHKDSPDKLKLLKEMQVAWIKMRDAQCEFAMRNVGGNAAQAGVICEIKATQQRAKELQEM